MPGNNYDPNTLMVIYGVVCIVAGIAGFKFITWLLSF